jgi:tripartite-type tricarboxylate transporter receptor subunit TctC
MTMNLKLMKSLPAIFLILFFGVAEAWPDKAITIVVPTAAGGGNDGMARILAQRLAAKLGQSVIVDNKAGGNGAIASEHVARAIPDGYTILFGYIATHGINPALQKLRYDPVSDFEPIGMVAQSPTVMVINADVNAKTARDVVQLLKSKPGSLSFASAGNGTAPHFAGELFKLSTGTDMLHVPYKGSGPAMMDTIGGSTQVMFPSLFAASPHVKSGKLRMIGVAGDKRLDAWKEVPTLAEQGIKDVSIKQWYALFAPGKTPKAIVERLNKELNAVLAEPDVVKRLAEQGSDVETSTPAELRAFVQAEIARWKKVVTAAKITAD